MFSLESYRGRNSTCRFEKKRRRGLGTFQGQVENHISRRLRILVEAKGKSLVTGLDKKDTFGESKDLLAARASSRTFKIKTCLAYSVYFTRLQAINTIRVGKSIVVSKACYTGYTPVSMLTR